MAVLRLFSRTLDCCRSLENLLKSAVSWKPPFYSTEAAAAAAAAEVSGRNASSEGSLSMEVVPPRKEMTEVPPSLVYLKDSKWSKRSRRTGLIAIKLGMTQMWNKEGRPQAVTALQMIDNQVVMVRTKEKEGYFGLQIGAINHPRRRKVIKPVLGQYWRARVPPKRKLMEFRVTEDALVPAATKLFAAHFAPGQYVDVCAKSIGKGFQGVMKRHHMKGQPASHGVTKTHRKMGATGGGQDPGRIWPGKRMPGRMGGVRVTSQCRKVLRVNSKYNVVYIKGPVPGHKSTYVRVTDARFKANYRDAPFPTFIPGLSPDQPEEVYSDDIHVPHEGSLAFEDKRKKKKSKTKK